MNKKLIAFLIISCFMVSSVAFAGRANSSHPCSADVKKYCQDVDPGKGRMRKCLKKNKKNLSDACTAKLEQAEQEMKRISKACKKDKKKLCSGKDKSESFKCLKANKKDLSAECKTEINKTF